MTFCQQLWCMKFKDIYHTWKLCWNCCQNILVDSREGDSSEQMWTIMTQAILYSQGLIREFVSARVSNEKHWYIGLSGPLLSTTKDLLCKDVFYLTFYSKRKQLCDWQYLIRNHFLFLFLCLVFKYLPQNFMAKTGSNLCISSLKILFCFTSL